MKSLMSARRCLVVALATAMILTGARFTKARTAGVTLVRDGVPQALLMVEAGAPKSMRAAEALQTYLERMSGAQLPQTTQPRKRVTHAHDSPSRFRESTLAEWPGSLSTDR